MTGALIMLAAILAVCGAWQLYMRHHRRERRDDDPAACPPETAVPVDSPLVHRFFATRDWSLLSDDFVLVLPGGRRVGADALTPSNSGPPAEIEAIYADLEQPSVLYVRDVQTWTRLIVAPCGTRIRELGPTSS